MKLYEVTNGASRTHEISEKEFVNYLFQNCKLSAKQINKYPIFRGVSTKLRLMVGDTSNGSPRQSKNTANYYTLWIDNSPEWEQFPKRSRSFICSTSLDYASDFGDTYLVIPFDDAKIGVCPEHDIWFSFESKGSFGVESLENLNDIIDRVFKIFSELDIENYGNKRIDQTNFNSLKTFLTTVNIENLQKAKTKLETDGNNWDSLIKKDLEFGISTALALLKDSKTQNFADMMDVVLTPKDFKLFSGKTFNPKITSSYEYGNECFIGGKALFLPIFFSARGEHEEMKQYLDHQKLTNILEKFKK